MTPDVTQGTSPAITDPTFLSPEALRPASTDDVLSALANVSTAGPKPRVSRRGRPPGSKNRTPAERAAATNPALAEQQDEEKKRAAKRARAEELEKQIYGELNDQLMTLLIGMFNIPMDFLYLPGKGPVIQKKDERFTELGNMLAIPPTLAKSIGKLASELENTEAGSKVAGVAQNSNVGLIVAGGMTIFGTVQYARKISDTFEKLQPVLEARKRFLANAAEKGEEVVQTDSAVSNSGSVA